MNHFTVQKRVALTSHRSTGRTRHFVEGQLADRPAALKIVSYQDGSGVYLIHFDAAGEEVTDTFHETVADAMAQAEFEFGVADSEWSDS